GRVDPPLAAGAVRFRLVVKAGTWSAFVGGQKLCEESLPEQAPPWLTVHAPAAATAAVRNLVITGTPTVPEAVALTALPDLTGWFAYGGEPVGDANAAWLKRGEELTAKAARVE